MNPQLLELLKKVQAHDDFILGDDPWYAMEEELRAELDKAILEAEQ